MNKYKIVVHTTIDLTFFVDDYEVVQGTQCRFYDQKSGNHRIFDSRICEITELLKTEIENGTIK